MNRITARYWTKKDRKAAKRAKTFKELAKVAIRIARRLPSPVGQVCGPITTGGVGTVKGNIRIFKKTIFDLQKSGKSIADQVPFEKPLWKIMKNFPRKWGKPNKKDLQLLEEFYGTLFRSGVIKVLYFMPGWEHSFGACWEYSLGKELGLEIHFMKLEKNHESCQNRPRTLNPRGGHMKVLPDSGYPIRPEDIDVSHPFLGVFGKFEAEEVARAIVRYAQNEDRWNPFTLSDVRKFLQKVAGSAIITIKGSQELRREQYLEIDEADPEVYYVTTGFINRCHEASPASKEV